MRPIPIDVHENAAITAGWQAAPTPPGAFTEPAELRALDWLSASVPGTAAAAMARAGRWQRSDSHSFDAEDWWFRTTFAAPAPQPGEEVVLCLDGIATLAEVFLNGERICDSGSMFAPLRVDVSGLLAERNELAICCRALEPVLAQRRSPRARWRTRLVSDGALRFHRTMLLGRAPGFAPGPAAVGPWRAVRLERRRGFALDTLALRTRLEGSTGLLEVDAQLRALDGDSEMMVNVELSGPSGAFHAPLTVTGTGGGIRVRGQLRVPQVACWWPHTHGSPTLHDVRLQVDCAGERAVVTAGRVGFRTIAAGSGSDHDLERDGIDLHVNGVRVFVRGALWTPLDPVGFASEQEELRAALECVRDGGMNMLRVPGTSCYEQQAFHDLCDELGILVWQDFMFANLDYPIADPVFRASVIVEARTVLESIGARPSLAVLCGNSEVEQQVAMLGLDPSLGRGELFGELLPALVAEASVDALYLPSAPCGGDMPFRTDRGVANYFGVGGYRRPLSDVRASGVRFASECLAFANVPAAGTLAELFPDGPPGIDDPRWKAGVARDVGADWDFDDVRDHYLALLYGVDPLHLRAADPARYLELSRAVSGEVMAEVFGEWRRAQSPCGGGLVLWLRDLAPGAGWGLLDHRGHPKAAYHYLRRALAPVCVWLTDEGLNGVDVHLANDRSEPSSARLRIALYRDLAELVEEVSEAIELEAHTTSRRGVEELLGRFVDAAWAYRFGPSAHDLIVATLEEPDGQLISQATLFPTGRPHAADSLLHLGLEAQLTGSAIGARELRVRSRRLAYGVTVQVPGFVPSEQWFCVEPGHERVIALAPLGAEGQAGTEGQLTALNLQGALALSAL